MVENISIIVISSDKTIIEKRIPKITAVEYNKIVLTPHSNLRVMTKNKVAIPVPTNVNTEIIGMSFKSTLKEMSKIIKTNNANNPDAKEVI